MNKTEFENYFTGNCTAEQSREAEQWIRANVETEEFAHLSRELLENMAVVDPVETGRAYARLRRRIASICGVRSRLRRTRYLRAAGVAALAALVGGCLFFTFFNMGDASPAEPVYADLVQQYCRRGSSRDIVLPDSSVVTLFGDSRIVYDRNSFDRRREVWLFGDAFFDVAGRQRTTFDVKCINTDIRVLGTSFEVLSHDADDNFEVSLYSGAVRMTPRYNGHSDTLRLNPGDVVRIDKLSGTITRHTAPWLGNDSVDVVYIGSKVTDILARLERRFDKSITLVNKNAELSQRRLNLIFHPDDSLETILSAICEFSDLSMSRHDGTIELR